MWYLKDSASPRWFYNFSSGKWEAPDTLKNFTGWWQVSANGGIFQKGIIKLSQTGANLTYENQSWTGLVSKSQFDFELIDGGFVRSALLGDTLYGSCFFPASMGGPTGDTFTAQMYTGVTYEVWAGNVTPPSAGPTPYFSFVTNNYTKLGQSSVTATFNGSYLYFFVLAKTDVHLDAIQGSSGDYWIESMHLNSYSDETTNMPSIYGTPDGAYASIGAYTVQDYRGSFGLKNSLGWTGITVVVVP